ncbi:MAG: ABC transporter ATP-binding protein [Spirochaetes bacterium]|nr:ABC transporter ATP-binding protein [Spirochaetota bacterium]
MSEIEFRSVSKSFGTKQVLKNLSFRIHPGECFTILGPSGCGKTIAVRLIAGFETPDRGIIRIGSTIVADGSKGYALPPENRNIGVVFQDYAVWPHMNVLENVLYPLRMQKVPKEEALQRARAAIKQVNMDGLEERLPYQLSGGQQQRVALARALVSKPAILLLDEPLSNLDANLREEMRFEIKELQKSTNSTLLYVTHDQEVALAISDRIAVMNEKGEFQQVGTPEEVYDQPANPFVFRFLGIANFIPVYVKEGKTFLTSNKKEFLPLPTKVQREDGIQAENLLAACRPMEVELSRTTGPLEGKVVRKALLGPIIDYRIDLGGTIVRAQLQTEEGSRKNLIFEEGDSCGVTFSRLLWFPRNGEGEGTHG